MILWRNWGGWHALNVFSFKIEYVCRFYSYERKLKKRYSETQDDYRKDNKALRSVIFITKFTKI